MIKYQVVKYGGSDQLKEVHTDIPVINHQQILIQVKATSATTADYRIRSGDFSKGFNLIGRFIYGFKKPKTDILGTEISGKIVQIGNLVTKFKLGDEVVVQLGGKMGGYQEYIALDPRKNAIILKPINLSHIEAATMTFGSATAYYYLCEKIHLVKGQSILIFGASGSVGTSAVQIAKQNGATVTAVTRLENSQLLKKLGADDVIDYRNLDFTKLGKFDVVMDCAGMYSMNSIQKLVKSDGKLLIVSGSLPDLLLSSFSKIKVITGIAIENQTRLEKIAELYLNKKIIPVIDQVFHFREINKAHDYIEQRHRKGNIAIQIA